MKGRAVLCRCSYPLKGGGRQTETCHLLCSFLVSKLPCSENSFPVEINMFSIPAPGPPEPLSHTEHAEPYPSFRGWSHTQKSKAVWPMAIHTSGGHLCCETAALECLGMLLAEVRHWLLSSKINKELNISVAYIIEIGGTGSSFASVSPTYSCRSH